MSTDDISGLIPEIYYDLIARVAAGVTVIAVLIWPSWSQIRQVETVTMFIMLVGAGYVVGHLLTTISTLLNALIWRPSLLNLAKRLIPNLRHDFNSTSSGEIFAEIYARIDWVAKRDRSGGTLLKKMEAGAALSDSLFAGWIIAGIVSSFTHATPWGGGLRSTDCILFSVVTLLLFFSVLIRRLVFIVRQDRMLDMLNYPKGIEEME
jgi:hypothetical protein